MMTRSLKKNDACHGVWQASTDPLFCHGEEMRSLQVFMLLRSYMGTYTITSPLHFFYHRCFTALMNCCNNDIQTA